MRRFTFPSPASSIWLLILEVTLASCQGGPTGPSSSVILSTTSLVFSVADEQRPVMISNHGGSSVDWTLLSTSISWLTVSPATGTIPGNSSGSFIVHVNRAAIPQGSHTATLQVMAGGTPHTLDVSVQQGTAAVAGFRPSAIAMDPLDDSAVVEVVNNGGSILNWSLAPGASWATVNPATGSLVPGGSTQVVVTANRSGLAKGSYVGKLYLTSNGGNPAAGVTVQVGEGAGLHLDPANLSFGLSNSSQPLRIVNEGYEPLSWTADPGASWITLSSKSGSIAPRSNGEVTVSVDRGGLSHGLHQAAIRFRSNGGSAAANVTVNAAPIGSTPPSSSGPAELQISPAALDFGEAGSELSFVLFNTGDEPLDWTRSTEAPWVVITPASGRISPHGSAAVTVKVLRPGLAAGSYQGAIQFTSNGGTRTGTISARVTMGVPPAPDPGGDPNPDPDGGPGSDPNPEPAQMTVSPTALDFGESSTELTLLVQNKGDVALDWTAQRSNNWLSLPVASGQVPANGSRIITVRASRATLGSAGEYLASIQFGSNGGSAVVAVALRVPSTPQPPSPPPPPGGSGLSGIDATGRTEVTDQLNDYFAELPDGSEVTLPANARYRVEGVIRLVNKTNLTINGNGALIFAETNGYAVTPPEELAHLWPRQRSQFEVAGGSNITVRNLSVRGSNPNAGSGTGAYVAILEAQHGFNILGVNGLVLDNVTATDTYGDLIYIGGRNGWARNIRVVNSHFERSGRQGIAITGAENVQILDSYIGEVGRSTIDIEPSTAGGGARNVLFQGNTFGPCRHLLLAASGRGPNVSNIVFVENRLVGIGLKIAVGASDGSRRGNFRILDNVSEIAIGMPVAAVRFSRVDGIEVRGNYQRMNEDRLMIGVSACESTNIVVGDNDFPGAAVEYKVIACTTENEEE